MQPFELPVKDEDQEIVKEIKDIQRQEQESNIEQEEYEAEVAAILAGMQLFLHRQPAMNIRSYIDP
jgi:hypothetical protein